MPMPAMGMGAAMPNAPQRGGKEARGKVVAGLGLELLRMAIPLLGMSEDGQAVTEVVAKLGKKFGKPPQDLGQSEMKFMQSQLYPQPRPQAMNMGPQVQSSLQGAGVPAAPPPGAGAPGAEGG